LDVRLLWESRSGGERGAFALKGGVLHLTALPGGRLDRVALDPGSRPGIHVRLSDASLLLEARGSCAFMMDGRVDSRAELNAVPVLFRGADGAVIELRAEGLPAVEKTPADPLVGRVLGAYQVLERLGSGAVGVVYKAIQAGLEREVALKVLNPKAATPLTVVSFKREAVAAGRLSHPNLVQVYEIGHEQGLHFFSMELVPGGTLERRLAEHGPLPWRDALGCARDCAEALAFAQDHHLVHRDVKPENLMLTKDGRVKLADLGMAATRGMLEQESAGGSPHFMAPECVGGVVDHRADLYSLGCSLYRLLTGETPFKGETVKEILRAHRDAPPPSAREHAPEVPAEVDALVVRLLAKSPADRPADARAVAAEIGELLQPRRSKAPVLVLALVALTAAGTAIWLATRPQDPGREPERVIEYVERGETAEQAAARTALELERAFLQAMMLPEGAERRAALTTFLDAHPDSEFSRRVHGEIARLDGAENAAASSSDDPLASMRAALTVLTQEVETCIRDGRYGQAHARVVASGVPAAVRGPLDARLGGAADAAFREWETRHAQALAAQRWSEASAVREQFARSLGPDPGQNPPPAEWSDRLAALAEQALSAERDARLAAFDSTRRGLIAALQGPVRDAVLVCDLTAALAALDAAAAACPHAEMRAALLAERECFAAAALAAQALRARLSGAAEVPIVEPVEGKRALAVLADDTGIKVLVQIRGERIERTDPWSAYDTAGAFGGLLRAVIPAEVPDESVVALHLLFGQAIVSAQLRNRSLGDLTGAADRGSAAAAWLVPLPRVLAAIPAWLPRHRAAFDAFSDLHAALGAQDAYLAWQRAQCMAAEFSLLGAWCSDGGATWQFQP
jgi:hypothetical protein